MKDGKPSPIRIDVDWNIEDFTSKWALMTQNIPFPTKMCGVPIEDIVVTDNGFEIHEKQKKGRIDRFVGQQSI